MDSSFVVQILYMLLLLPFIIFLIYITLKYSGKYVNNYSKGKIIKVIERVQLSQNSFLAVVLIKDKPYLISSCEKGIEILLELEEDSIDEYIKNLKGNIPFNYSLLNKLRGKIKNEKI